MSDSRSGLVQLGARLKRIRYDSGLSQAEFAVLGGVGLSSQQQYEAGKTPFNVEYLLNIMGHGFDGYYLLTGRLRADDNDDTRLAAELFAALDSHQQDAVIALMRAFEPDRPGIANASAAHSRSSDFSRTLQSPRRDFAPR